MIIVPFPVFFRTYTLEDFPLLIAASVIYATFDKFYSKESLTKLFIETLADLVNLSGYTRGQLYIFSDALLGTIDRHEIDTKYFMCLSKTLWRYRKFGFLFLFKLFRWANLKKKCSPLIFLLNLFKINKLFLPN